MMCKTLRPPWVGHFTDTYTLWTQQHTHFPDWPIFQLCSLWKAVRGVGIILKIGVDCLNIRVYISSIYYYSQSSFPLSLDRVFPTPSSVLTQLTMTRNEGYNSSSFLSVTSCHKAFWSNCISLYYSNKRREETRTSICVTTYTTV